MMDPRIKKVRTREKRGTSCLSRRGRHLPVRFGKGKEGGWGENSREKKRQVVLVPLLNQERKVGGGANHSLKKHGKRKLKPRLVIPQERTTIRSNYREKKKEWKRKEINGWISS